MSLLPMVVIDVDGLVGYEVRGPHGVARYIPAAQSLTVHERADQPYRLPEVTTDRADIALREHGNAGLRLFLNRWHDEIRAIFDPDE